MKATSRKVKLMKNNVTGISYQWSVGTASSRQLAEAQKQFNIEPS